MITCYALSYKDWNPVTKAEAQDNYWLADQVSKTYADKAVIDFAQSHLHMDGVNAPSHHALLIALGEVASRGLGNYTCIILEECSI